MPAELRRLHASENEIFGPPWPQKVDRNVVAVVAQLREKVDLRLQQHEARIGVVHRRHVVRLPAKRGPFAPSQPG